MDMNKALTLYGQVMREHHEQPTLQEYLHNLGPMPKEGIVMGICNDGLPLIFNTSDSDSPAIIMWNGESEFLKVIAEHIITRDNSSLPIEFAVITNSVDDWTFQGNLYNHCAAAFHFFDDGAEQLLLHLASWAHSNKNSKRAIFLLIDGFEGIDNLNFDARQNLRWLLLRGPSRKVFVVAVGKHTNNLLPWEDGFRCQMQRYADYCTVPEGYKTLEFRLPVTSI
jgi:hypothetical protein